MGKLDHLSKQECYDILNEALKTGADFAEVFAENTKGNFGNTVYITAVEPTAETEVEETE